MDRWRSDIAVTDFPRTRVVSTREDKPAVPLGTRYAHEPLHAAPPPPIITPERVNSALPAHATCTLPIPSASVYMGPSVPPGMMYYPPQPVLAMAPFGYTNYPGPHYPQPQGQFYPPIYSHLYAQFPGPMWPQMPGNAMQFVPMPPYPGPWYPAPYVTPSYPQAEPKYTGRS